MTHHRIINKGNAAYVNNGAGPAYPSEVPKFSPSVGFSAFKT